MPQVVADLSTVQRYWDTVLGQMDHVLTGGQSALTGSVMKTLKWTAPGITFASPELQQDYGQSGPTVLRIHSLHMVGRDVSFVLSMAQPDNESDHFMVELRFDAQTKALDEEKLSLFDEAHARRVVEASGGNTDGIPVRILTQGHIWDMLSAFMADIPAFMESARTMSLMNACLYAAQLRSEAPDVESETCDAVFQNSMPTKYTKAHFVVELENRGFHLPGPAELTIEFNRKFAATHELASGGVDLKLFICREPDGSISECARESRFYLNTDIQVWTDIGGQKSVLALADYDVPVPPRFTRHMYPDAQPTLDDLAYFEQFILRPLTWQDLAV